MGAAGRGLAASQIAQTLQKARHAADLHSHNHEDLFIASSGVMASAGTVCCAQTLAALSMRLADRLIDECRHA